MCVAGRISVARCEHSQPLCVDYAWVVRRRGQRRNTGCTALTRGWLLVCGPGYDLRLDWMARQLQWVRTAHKTPDGLKHNTSCSTAIS